MERSAVGFDGMQSMIVLGLSFGESKRLKPEPHVLSFRLSTR